MPKVAMEHTLRARCGQRLRDRLDAYLEQRAAKGDESPESTVIIKAVVEFLDRAEEGTPHTAKGVITRVLKSGSKKPEAHG